MRICIGTEAVPSPSPSTVEWLSHCILWMLRWKPSPTPPTPSTLPVPVIGATLRVQMGTWTLCVCMLIVRTAGAQLSHMLGGNPRSQSRLRIEMCNTNKAASLWLLIGRSAWWFWDQQCPAVLRAVQRRGLEPGQTGLVYRGSRSPLVWSVTTCLCWWWAHRLVV